MQKVILVVPSLIIGGGEKLVLDIAQNIDKSLFDVTILSFYGPLNTFFEQQAEQSKLKVIYLGKKFGFDPRIIIKARRVTRNLKPDVLSTHLGVLPYLIWFTNKIKLKYHTIHSMASREASGIRKYLHKYAFKYLGYSPIAICDTVKKSIVDYYDLKIEDIPKINNGINREIFKENKEIKIDDTKLKVIATGGFRPVKNHILMLDAFFLFLLKFPNASLTICGDGELRNQIEQKILELDIADKVVLKGNIKDVATELNQSDVYLMSSDFEGLSLAIAEAMSCGLPIVTTASGGTIDIVKNGINGFVTPIGDAKSLAKSLYKLAVDKKLRDDMSKMSKELVQDFDIVKTVKQYERLFMGEKI